MYSNGTRYPGPADAGYPQDLPAAVDLAEQQADAELPAEVAAFGDLPVQRTVLVGAGPAAEIIASLRHEPADFVVMAMHGHGRLRRALAAGVTDQVVWTGLAPVVVVPTGGTARAERDAAAWVPRGSVIPSMRQMRPRAERG
jgi:nucleotide-binding universal stress UspA family protein